MPQFDFDTGPSTLPDIGELSYNGCTFSPLFTTKVSGNVVQDEAGRTTKLMDYGLEVDGVVTLPDNLPDITVPMTSLRELLTQQAGTLIYDGRGLNLRVNVVGAADTAAAWDVAWGPIPKLLEFTPLGGGRSAMVKWRVQTRVSELAPPANTGIGPVLQFNFDTAIGYGEDGYSSLDIKGILEVPLTRPTQATRTLDETVDDFRFKFMKDVAKSIDLTRFRVTRRTFEISRDRRTMQFHFSADELPPQGLPSYVTIARGTYSFSPAHQGMGLCTWLCSLRVTYVVAKNQPRRLAWLAFLALLRWRMLASRDGTIPSVNAANQNNQGPGNAIGAVAVALIPGGSALQIYRALLGKQNAEIDRARAGSKAWIIDFRGEEGLYADSKTVTFSASWRLVASFSSILVASGIWKYVSTDGGNNWASSIQAISGWRSWLSNRIDPAQDFIVDFGQSQ